MDFAALDKRVDMHYAALDEVDADYELVSLQAVNDLADACQRGLALEQELARLKHGDAPPTEPPAARPRTRSYQPEEGGSIKRVSPAQHPAAYSRRACLQGYCPHCGSYTTLAGVCRCS